MISTSSNNNDKNSRNDFVSAVELRSNDSKNRASKNTDYRSGATASAGAVDSEQVTDHDSIHPRLARLSSVASKSIEFLKELKGRPLNKPKVVVITGASAGVGRATVTKFAQKGASLGLIARNEEALEDAKREVEALGGKALVLVLDVADADAMEAAAAAVERELGPIDVWVNNAMVSVFSPVDKMQPEEYKRVTEVTYLGYVYGTLAALKYMRARNRGTIVQVSSALAYRSIPLQSAYCAAKHAIKGFSESLRCELLHDHSDVRVTLVHMPALNTPQFSWVKNRLPNKPQPVPPIFQPEVAADAIHWAALHAPKSIDVGFPTVKAVYGERVIPSLLDHYLGKTCYDSQQTDVADDHSAPNNLWQTVPGDHGAHGSFDARSTGFSLQLWLRMNCKFLVLIGTVVLTMTSLFRLKQRVSRR